MVGPGDVSMDGSEDQNPQGPSISKALDPAVAGKDTPSKGDGAKAKDKRERLSRACVACHTGKTRCSNTLPCESCVKRGIANSCAYPDPLDAEATANHPIAPRRRAGAHGHGHGSPASVQTHQNTGVPGGGGGVPGLPGPGPNQQQGGPPPPGSQPQTAGQTVFSAGPTVRGFYYDNGSGSGQGTFVPAPSVPSSNGSVSLVGPGTPGTASLSLGIRREATPPQGGGARPTKKARYRNLTDAEIASFQTPKGSTFKRGTFYVGESAPVTIDPRLPLRLLLADDQRVDFFVGDGLPP